VSLLSNHPKNDVASYKCSSENIAALTTRVEPPTLKKLESI
jgi:hypothetical protein